MELSERDFGGKAFARYYITGVERKDCFFQVLNGVWMGLALSHNHRCPLSGRVVNRKHELFEQQQLAKTTTSSPVLACLLTEWDDRKL